MLKPSLNRAYTVLNRASRQVVTLPSELRGKREQLWPVGSFNLVSSNLSRLLKVVINTKAIVKQDKPEGKAEVHKELEEGLEVLIQNNVDLIIVEVLILVLVLVLVLVK